MATDFEREGLLKGHAGPAREARRELLELGDAGSKALERGGDWYGRPVNLASRITGIARPGSVLAAEIPASDQPRGG